MFFVFNFVYLIVLLLISTVIFWLGISFAKFFWSFLKEEGGKVLQCQFERKKHG